MNASQERIKDNAIIILDNIKNNLLSAEDLTIDMRRVCVDYLDNEGIKVEEMSKLLCVTTTTLYGDLNALQDTYASMMTLVNFKRVFGTYTRRYTSLRNKALRDKDYRLAWQMDNDYLDKLMEVGFIKKMPDEIIIKTEKDMTPDEERELNEILFKIAERRNRDTIKKVTGITENEWFGGNGEGGE